MSDLNRAGSEPTVDQLYCLVDAAERRQLTLEEAHRLRMGIVAYSVSLRTAERRWRMVNRYRYAWHSARNRARKAGGIR